MQSLLKDFCSDLVHGLVEPSETGTIFLKHEKAEREFSY